VGADPLGEVAGGGRGAAEVGEQLEGGLAVGFAAFGVAGGRARGTPSLTNSVEVRLGVPHAAPTERGGRSPSSARAGPRKTPRRGNWPRRSASAWPKAEPSAIGGEWGTLSEIGHARSIGRTVVALRSWALVGRDRMEGAPGIVQAETPEEAVASALAEL
jgi:hypothetical protein